MWARSDGPATRGKNNFLRSRRPCRFPFQLMTPESCANQGQPVENDAVEHWKRGGPFTYPGRRWREEPGIPCSGESLTADKDDLTPAFDRPGRNEDGASLSQKHHRSSLNLSCWCSDRQGPVIPRPPERLPSTAKARGLQSRLLEPVCFYNAPGQLPLPRAQHFGTTGMDGLLLSASTAKHGPMA